MKEKRITMYLAIEEVLSNYGQKKDLFSLKNEVEEFELHNIKVQSYSTLQIDAYNIIKEMD